MLALSQEKIRILKDLGLSEIQIKLYLTSLNKGVLSVLELSKLTNINRQQIYEQAEKMVDIGLYDITRKQRRKYIPANPEKLITISKKNIANLQLISDRLLDIVPILKEINSNNKNKVITRYFEGHGKINEAYGEELAQSKSTEILSLAGLIDEIFKYFPEDYWDKFNKTFAKQNNSKARMLVHYSDAAKLFARKDNAYKLETRYLHNFPLKVNIDIFNNVVLIVSPADELAVWIESDIISQSYRILFESLWSQAKKFQN